MPQSRRVTIPSDHIAIILHKDVADDLLKLATSYRRSLAKKMARLTKVEKEAPITEPVGRSVDRQDAWNFARIEHNILGDLLLAMVEAHDA